MLKYSLFEIIFTQRNVDSTSNDSYDLRASFQGAGLSDGSIRIAILSGYTTIILKIFKSMRRKTSIASVVVVGTCAINELLFTKISELTVFHHIVSFQAAHCREGPATSAVALVFNRCNNTLISPVP